MVILLHAFEEKSGNDGKDKGYKSAADIADKRLREVITNGKTK
jgi:hypothetical protein